MLLTIASLPADFALSLATASVVLCPVLCGLMAYRVSRSYAKLRAS
ncbi:MAG: hypothetical protein ACKO7W_07365 [Elainella sp.]